MLGLYILDASGEPVPCADMMTWALWMETSNRQVALDVCGDTQVSTVFLGLDHSFRPGFPAILYETMIFGGRFNLRQWRYTTRGLALQGHRDVLAMVSAGTPTSAPCQPAEPKT